MTHWVSVNASRLAAAPPSRRAGAGVLDPAERDGRLVVDGLVVDVHQAARDPLGDLQAAHHVAGEDAQGQPVRRVARRAATASSTVSKRTTGATGPKISSV